MGDRWDWVVCFADAVMLQVRLENGDRARLLPFFVAWF